MPLPICPAPTTPIFSIFIVLTVLSPSLCASPPPEKRSPLLLVPPDHSSSSASYRLLELGQGLKQIGNQAVIGDAENGRAFVLVDGNDDFGILHACKMLDRTGNSDCDVELGRHHLSGLADLAVVGNEAGIDGGARCADSGAESIRDALDQRKILFRLQT